jgi:inner membrane transporter RhtA
MNSCFYEAIARLPLGTVSAIEFLPVIPYVCDQLAMTRLSRATYSLMVLLLPATATVIGIIVLAQIPTARQVLGVVLVVVAVGLHRDRAKAAGAPRPRRRARAGLGGLRTPGTRPSR